MVHKWFSSLLRSAPLATGVLVLSAAALLQPACTSDDATAEALKRALEGGSCNIHSDCNDPLVCAFKKCHTQCQTARDCTGGQPCVAVDKPYRVCQAPNERRQCTLTSECPTPHVCAVDGICRAECRDVRDCAGDQVCSYGTCANPEDLVNGTLRITNPKAGVDKLCAIHSDCTGDLRCISGRCTTECTNDRDCPQDRACVEAACAPRGTGGTVLDASLPGTPGSSGWPCKRTSECKDGLSCVYGVCDIECRTARDCGLGQECDTTNRCRYPSSTVDGGGGGGGGGDADADSAPPPPPSCSNTVKDGSETGLDCGGPCRPCPVGEGCVVASDCAGRRCEAGVCATPTCVDGIADGDEADADCGGSCSPCGFNKTCRSYVDCTSRVCIAGVCRGEGCGDGLKNGTETDVDCGGASCPTCGDGKICAVGTDCASTLCQGGSCAAPTCTDGAKNGSESDIDCGGSGSCLRCGDNKACLLNRDCASGNCFNGRCQPTSCIDNRVNGSETDVDCGGSACRACSTWQRCSTNTDCLSGNCQSNVCQGVRCNDSIQNGSETDIDCGGTVCNPCDQGKVCQVDLDCASRRCLSGRCPVTFPVTVTRSGTGVGDVTGGGVIDCGPTCLGYVPENGSITLTATPRAGVVFTGWTGACTGTAACTIQVTQAVTVRAIFDVAGTDFTPLFARAYPPPHAVSGAQLDPAGELVLLGRAASSAAIDFGYGPLTARGASRVWIARYSTNSATPGQPLWAYMHDDVDRKPIGLGVGTDGHPAYAMSIEDQRVGNNAIWRQNGQTGAILYQHDIPLAGRGGFSQDGYHVAAPDWFGVARNGDAVSNSESAICSYDEGCSYTYLYNACRAKVTGNTSALLCLIQNLCNDITNFVRFAVGDSTGAFFYTMDAVNRTCNLGGGDRFLGSAWIWKTTSTGAYVWDRTIGGTGGTARVLGMTVDANDDLIVVGEFRGLLLVNPTLALTSVGGTDAFIMRIDGRTGQGIWGQRYGGLGDEGFLSVGLMPSGEYLAAMTYPANAGYNFHGVDLPSRPAGANWFLTRLNSNGLVLAASAIGDSGVGTFSEMSVNGTARRVVVRGTTSSAANFGNGVTIPAVANSTYAVVLRTN